MTKVVYDGPSPAVNIAVEGGSIVAERGEPVDVPDALAKSLCEQETFSLAEKKDK